MYRDLTETILGITNFQTVDEKRRSILKPLIDTIQKKVDSRQVVNINFICTHNSRRSHLSQVWAQAAAAYFNIPNVFCYSGGTQETEIFPKVLETLSSQGFSVFKIRESDNAIYSIRYDDNAPPIIGFSKKYDNPFNPASAFIAVMTCSQADNGCPFIPGAKMRIPITYEDPKIADGTPEQAQVYAKRSLQIATEMCYVFSLINC